VTNTARQLARTASALETLDLRIGNLEGQLVERSKQSKHHQISPPLCLWGTIGKRVKATIAPARVGTDTARGRKKHAEIKGR
jgi:hypothetical protein